MLAVAKWKKSFAGFVTLSATLSAAAVFLQADACSKPPFLAVIVGDSVSAGTANATWQDPQPPEMMDLSNTPAAVLTRLMQESSNFRTGTAVGLGLPGSAAEDWLHPVGHYKMCSYFLSRSTTQTYYAGGYGVLQVACANPGEQTLMNSVESFLRRRPSIVIVMFGINDVAKRSRTPRQAVDSLTMIKKYWQSRGVPALLATPTRVASPEMQSLLDEMSDLMRTGNLVAEGLDFNAVTLPTVDGTHPTVEADQTIGRMIFQALQTQLSPQ